MEVASASQFAIHDEIEKRRGKLLREFSQALYVAAQHPTKYVEMLTKPSVSGIGSIRRYARSYNVKAGESNLPKVSIYQVKGDNGSSTVYVSMVKAEVETP